MKETQIITLRLAEADAEKLREEAERSYRSVSKQVAFFIEQGLSNLRDNESKKNNEC